MITQTMVQPSSWIENGIKLQTTRGLNFLNLRMSFKSALRP